MPAPWLTVLAWLALAVAFVSAAEITVDIFGRGYRQRTRVMEAVRPVTALYFGPVASWAYRRFGRPSSGKWLREHDRDEPAAKPAGRSPRSGSAIAARAARLATSWPSSLCSA